VVGVISAGGAMVGFCPGGGTGGMFTGGIIIALVGGGVIGAAVTGNGVGSMAGVGVGLGVGMGGTMAAVWGEGEPAKKWLLFKIKKLSTQKTTKFSSSK